ncbi:Uncharacterised protein [Mycobacteroides abscessus]|nr:Uncharacterised protein [Mycobacteroides abscessus]
MYTTSATRSVYWPPCPSSTGSARSSMTFSTSQPGLTVGVTVTTCSGTWTETFVVGESPHPCGTPNVRRA